MRFTTATVLSTLAAFAAAYTQPDYTKSPQGNPIAYPSLNEQVPEGAPFKIQWDPTLGDKISLVLLRGPSSNVVPLETIVENIDNTGSYMWTPSTSLTVDTTHYGILLVVEGTGAYQWSTQFGIAAAAGSNSATAGSSSATVVTVIDDKTTTICPETETQATATPSVSAQPTSWSTAVESIEITTTICPETETGVATTMPMPTGSLTRRPTKPSTSPVSTSVGASATTSATPSATPAYNAAGQNTISFGAVVAAMFAVMAF
ncbi:uncharacterized protein N7484_009914 [Penicillium longicatenatum]|uniref:uncharacterized protein n=1 Tax=Penicillium longicatenatum TaxID=1561947 RepID=UPI0025472A15|nr:uncharacterized protein N7484_009914 [Penicillium longicatenatum]KAJ5636601.1 hypothetical protein N7484_009914 [Penicillium longicatenatum]